MSDPPHTLTAGQPLERELEGGGAHTYELELDAGRFVSVAVEQRGIDVFLRFYSPSGELLTEVDSPTGTTGTERVRAVAGAAGTHRLEVRSFEGVRKPGRYTVEIEESREATGDDRTRVAAERAFAEGETLRREGRYTDAESRYEQALDAWGSLEDRPGVAEALYRIGWVRGELGDALGAVDFLRDALADYRELGDRKQVAVTLNRLGANLARLGRLKEADEHLREALELATEIDEAVLRTSAAILLGNLHKWSGRTEEALRLYESALETADPWVVATIRYHIGDVYLARNDADAARLSLEQALEEARASGNRETEAFGLFKLGEALRRLDRLDAAEERLEDALALQRERGDRWGEAMTLDNLGTVLLQAGRLDDARRAFERGLEISTELGDLHGQALSRSKLGRYHHAAGDPERARADHETALPLFERTGDRQGVASSRYGIARALYETGDFEGAREALETALEDAESLRAESQSHALRASYLASRRHHWDLYVNTLMRLHEADPGGGFDRLALQAAERWRARGLLDLLAEADVELLQGAPEKLLKEEHRLRRELDGIERRRMEVLGRSDRTVDERTVAELEERQTRRLLDLDRVRSEIRRTSGRYRELTDPNPLRLGEIQGELLDRDTALLVYFLGEERSAVWVVSRSGVESRVLPDRETIEAAARDFHSLLPRISARAADARRRAGERLSELILGPVAGLLDAKRLAVVADGGLQVLPFAALPVPTAAEEAGSGEILLDRHEVVHLPSASVLGALRRLEGSGERAPRTVAVIADPVFGPDDPRIAGGPTGPGTGAGTGSGVEPGTDPELGRALRSFGPGGLERLPHTEDEALAIAGLAPEGSSLQALGFEADRSLLDRGKLADYRIVHFATHGLLHPRHPELSGLVLSLYDREGAPRDGFLRLHDVYNLRLGAELVVLSACETGLGRRVEGEGLVGLTRGFMYAGTPRIVHSLWKVSDESTAELMTRFYETLLGAEDERLPPAAALRAAQLSMREDERWREPFHWAGFVFQGDWAPPARALDDDDIEVTDDGGGGSAGAGSRGDEDLPPPGPPPLPAATEEEEGGGTVSATEPTVLNGVRPDGTYAYTAISDAELGRRLLHRGLDRPPATPPGDDFRAPSSRVNADDLSDAGWGVIFPSGTSGTIREALKPLLDLRKDQAGDLFQRLERYPEESYETFLRRHGEGPGEPDPERIPYYLLLVGGPEEIPFQFQWELDHLYAVGRVHFDDPEDYAAYARTVRDAERAEDAAPSRPHDLTFFGVRNENDSATRRTTDDLVLPLARGIEDDSRLWGTVRTRTVTGPEATRAELSRLLGGVETPDVLFTGSHGMVFDPGDPRQLDHQGAILCGDWPGRGHPTAREHYFAAEDLSPTPESGLPDITFHFACHGGGTPAWDSFPEPDALEPRRLAEGPFTAALPRKLLAHPRGGSRAVIAHVDRAWTTSFDWNREERRGRGGGPDAPKVFLGALASLLEGRRVGFAMEPFGQLYGALTRSFLSRWEAQPLTAARRGPYAGETPERLARAYLGANDARSFLVFGDPAVRLHRPARRAGY